MSSFAEDQLTVGYVPGSLFCFVDLCDYFHGLKHATLVTKALLLIVSYLLLYCLIKIPL